MKDKKSIEKPTMLIAFFCCIFFAVLLVTGLDYWKTGEPVMGKLPENKYEETLVVAADEDYQPYSFCDTQGLPAGYDIELMGLLAEQMKKNVQIQLMQWSSACGAVKAGKADILLGLDYNIEALSEYELSLPLDNDPFVAFGRKPIGSVEELYGKRLATLEQSGSFAAFLIPYQLLEQTQTFSSYTEAFQSVDAGDNDYVIAMYSVGRRAIANLGTTELEAVGPVLAGNNLSIGTKKGNTELMEELNHAITVLKKNGTMERLAEKWLGRYVEVISVWDYLENNRTVILIFLFTLSLCILLFSIISNKRFQKNAGLQHAMTKKVLEYQQLLTEATKGLYESIYELDITHNRAGGESTRQYFESLGISAEASFDDALKIIAAKQVKEEFVKQYLDTFCTANVLEAYKNGTDSLCYDFMLSSDGLNYYWMRITARIFYWAEDATVRMIIYQQNIDAERRKEQELEVRIQEDALTGLLNKTATERLIREKLKQNPQGAFAFIMLDIDNFKNINDSFGHEFGDYVIVEFARQLKRQAEGEITGRIGGDEFAVFLTSQGRERLEEKAAALNAAMRRKINLDGKACLITASIGIARYPEDAGDFTVLYRKADSALYKTKERGKNGYTICDGSR